MSNAAVVQDEAEDRFYTQVEAGDVRLFTLDQLDAAFNAGLIHENTYVCLEGSSEWQTLAEVAGLGDEEEAAPISAPQLIAQPVAHAPAVAHAPVAPQSWGVAAAPSIVPSAPSVAPYSVAPMVMSPSIRPVVNDLAFDDDMDMMAMRPKRKLGKVVAGLAVLALAGLGFAVVSSGGLRLPKLKVGDSGQVAQAVRARARGVQARAAEGRSQGRGSAEGRSQRRQRSGGEEELGRSLQRRDEGCAPEQGQEAGGFDQAEEGLACRRCGQVQRRQSQERRRLQEQRQLVRPAERQALSNAATPRSVRPRR
jgi:hypothetical protein